VRLDTDTEPAASRRITTFATDPLVIVPPVAVRLTDTLPEASSAAAATTVSSGDPGTAVALFREATDGS
jgi:hypothetical protein